MGPRGPTPPGMDMRHESVMMGGPSSMGAHSPMGGPMAGPMSGPGASAMGGNPVCGPSPGSQSGYSPQFQQFQQQLYAQGRPRPQMSAMMDPRMGPSGMMGAK